MPRAGRGWAEGGATSDGPASGAGECDLLLPPEDLLAVMDKGGIKVGAHASWFCAAPTPMDCATCAGWAAASVSAMQSQQAQQQEQKEELTDDSFV